MEDQLRKEGVPEANVKEAANLLAGQALMESGLDPTKTHDKGTGYGIFGARDPKGLGTGGRASNMLNWMKEHGYAKDSLEGQSRYMAHEAMTTKEYAPSRGALMGATEANRRQGVNTFIQNFERPQDRGPKQLAGRMGTTERAARVAADAKASQTAANAPSQGAAGTQTADDAPIKAGVGGQVQEAQGKAAAIRKGKLDPQLKTALEYAAEQSGVNVRVTSGGQRMHGAEGATGSHRHDKGRAADIDIVDPKTGRTLALDDPRRLKFLENSAAAGAGGTGTRYMSDKAKVHVGITGAGARVGEGLGAYAGPAHERAAVQRGLARMMSPDQVAEARQKQLAARQRDLQKEASEGKPKRDDTKRIDAAVTPPAASGKVDVTLNSNGTKAEASVKSEGSLFNDTTVRQHRQMRSTEEAGQVSI
jgi:hypothetical protein